MKEKNSPKDLRHSPEKKPYTKPTIVKYSKLKKSYLGSMDLSTLSVQLLV